MKVIHEFFASFIFWGAWIIIPVVMEIIPSLGSVFILLKKLIKGNEYDAPILIPDITMIIPVYNSAQSLENCIRSIYESDYPKDKIKILLINNQEGGVVRGTLRSLSSARANILSC